MHSGAGLWTCIPESSFSHVLLLIILFVIEIFREIIFTKFQMSLERHHRGGGSNAPKCGSKHLQLDQACLEFLIPNELESKLTFWAQSKECYKCVPWIIQDNLTNGTSIPVNTTYSTDWFITDTKYVKSELCRDSFHFGQYGYYDLELKHESTNTSTCHLKTIEEPSNPYLPILWAFIFFASLQICWSIGKSIFNSRKCRQYLRQIFRRSDSNDSQTDLIQDVVNEDQSTERPRRRRRVKSLDAFRGLAIVIMIFVNYGGGGYSFFAHAKWNGLTVADLVFPWFMWIMGVSLVISMQSQLRNSKPRSTIVLNIIRRSVILFSLGLIINSIGGNNDFRTMRIPGVLQRFGITYFIVGIIQAAIASEELPRLNSETNDVPWWWCIRDVKACMGQWMVMLILLVLYLYLTLFMPVPGCPTGYLGPGGLADHGQYQNCTGGSARYIDILVFGRDHIYQHPSAKRIYETLEPFDPEGLLGTLSASFTVFLGVQCGYTLLIFQEWKPRVKRWLLWSLVFGSIAGGLCGFSKENGLIPVSKNMWSLSFVMALASMALILLSVMYLLIDVYHLWDGSPFYYAGMNSILLYMGHEICEDFFPFSWIPYTQTHAELLFMNLWGMSLWILIAYILYKKGMFLSI